MTLQRLGYTAGRPHPLSLLAHALFAPSFRQTRIPARKLVVRTPTPESAGCRFSPNLEAPPLAVMKRLRNWQFVTGVSLLLVGLGILTAVLLRSPEREITRTELAALIQAKDFSHGRVTPTQYSGIYHIEGT